MCCFLRYLEGYTVGKSTKHATVIVETNFEILEPWNIGTLEPWNLGTLEPTAIIRIAVSSQSIYLEKWPGPPARGVLTQKVFSQQSVQ